MLFNKKFAALAMTAVLSVGLLAGCAPSNNGTSASGSEKIVLVGSTSVDPLAQKLAEAYKVVNPDINIEIQAVGSSAGIKAALDKTADIGMASRELKDSEIADGANPIEICKDGIAVVLHPDNPVKNLTSEQVRQIFMGEITNWSQVGGNDEEILVVSRESGSGTRGAFEEILNIEKELEGKKISGLVADALQAEGTGAIKANVASKTNAIGYISLEYVDATVTSIQVDGADATDANIVAGLYPIARPFIFITSGDISAKNQNFLDFVLGSEGQAVMVENGYIAIG